MTKKNVWDKQHGGNHYQKYVIQPSKFVVENKLNQIVISVELKCMGLMQR